MPKKLLLLLPLFLLSLLGQAQSYPVTISTQLTQPSPIYLNNYADATTLNSPIKVQLVLNDLSILNRQVRLKAYFKGNGIQFNTNDYVVGEKALYLEGGVPLQLTNVELAPYFKFQNLQGLNPNVYANALPEGIYEFCLEVYDVLTNKRLSRKSCVTTVIFQNDPPFLNLPTNKQEIMQQNIQNIVFSWTPRNINVSNVVYEFSLVEIWDNNTPVENAFLYSPPLYTTTVRNTILQYSINEPQLIPGKRYAWRVKAMAMANAEEIGVFKNNGYSAIFSFDYLIQCQAPLGIAAAQVSQDQAKITWSGALDNYDYEVKYRPKNANSDWYNLITPREYATLSNLKPNTTYQFSVGASCQKGKYTHSTLQQFTTLATEETAFAGCNLTPDPVDLSNQNLLPNLFANDVVKAGDFPIVVLKATGANGRFSGEGYVTFAFLEKFRTLIDAADALGGDKIDISKFSRIKVTFDNIGVNTDFKLISGVINASYDKEWGSIVDGDKIVNDVFGDNGKVVVATLDFEVASITKNADGSTTITGTNGTQMNVPVSVNDKEFKDSKGQIIKVPANGKGESTIEQAAAGGAATAANTNGMSSGGAVTQISSADVVITFENDKDSKYAFDQQADTDTGTLKGTYETIPMKSGTVYKVGYKAVSDLNGEETFIAKATFKNGKTKDNIVFKTDKGAKVETEWIDATTAKITIQKTFDFAKESIIATVSPTTQKTEEPKAKDDIAGKVNIWHLSQKPINVTLVSVNGATIPAKAAEDLNTIYNKAGVQFSVKEENIRIDNLPNKIICGSSDLLNTYTLDQISITTAIRKALGSSYDKETYYMLYTGSTADNGVDGFMPLGRQYGFIFDNKNHTLAHELGHGALRLEHPFTEFKTTKGSTTLLMDYADGTKLDHNNWQSIHGGGWKPYLFQNDADGALAGGYAIAPDWSFVSNGSEGTVKASGDSDSKGFLRGIVVNDVTYIWKLDSDRKFKYLNENSVPYTNPQILPKEDKDLIFLFFANQNSRGKYIKTVYKELASIIKSKSDKDLSDFITKHSTPDLYTKAKDEKRNTYWGYVGCSNCDSNGVENGSSDEQKLQDLIAKLKIKTGVESVASEAIILDKNNPQYQEKLAEALEKTSYILATYDSSGKESLKLQYKLQVPKAIKDLFPDFKTSDNCIQDYINNSLENLHKNLIYKNYQPVDQASLEICTVFYQGFFGMWSCATSEESIANSGEIQQCLAGATHEAIAMIDVVALVNGVATLAKEGTKTYLESYVKYYENLQSISSTIIQGSEVQTTQILGAVLIPPYNIASQVIDKVVKVADNFKKSYFTECNKTEFKNGKIADICWYRYGQLGAMIAPIIYTGGEYAVTKVKQIANISKTSITLAENVIKLNEKLIAKGVYLLEADGKTLIKNATTGEVVTVKGTAVKDVEKALDELGVVQGAGSFIPNLLNKVDNIENAVVSVAKNEAEILDELVKTNNTVTENAKKFWAQHEMNVTKHLDDVYGSGKVGQQITVDIYIQGQTLPVRCRIDNLIDVGGGKFRIVDGKSSIINNLSTKTPTELLNSMSTVNQKAFYDALKNGTITQIKPAGARAQTFLGNLNPIQVEKSVDFFVNDVSTNGYNIFKKTLILQ